MKLFSFSVASTIGKIPALFVEAYSVSHILNLPNRMANRIDSFCCYPVYFLFTV